jgi:hypothetical protein
MCFLKLKHRRIGFYDKKGMIWLSRNPVGASVLKASDNALRPDAELVSGKMKFEIQSESLIFRAKV